MLADTEDQSQLCTGSNGAGAQSGSDAVVGAIAALEAAAAPTLKGAEDRSTARHTRSHAELSALIRAIAAAGSSELRNAIINAAEAKRREIEADQASQGEDSDEATAIWEAAWDALQASARALLAAPVETAADAYLRGEAFTDAVGRDPENGLPVDDYCDLGVLLTSYRDTLKGFSNAPANIASIWSKLLAEWQSQTAIVRSIGDQLEITPKDQALNATYDRASGLADTAMQALVEHPAETIDQVRLKLLACSRFIYELWGDDLADPAFAKQAADDVDGKRWLIARIYRDLENLARREQAR